MRSADRFKGEEWMHCPPAILMPVIVTNMTSILQAASWQFRARGIRGTSIHSPPLKGWGTRAMLEGFCTCPHRSGQTYCVTLRHEATSVGIVW